MDDPFECDSVKFVVKMWMEMRKEMVMEKLCSETERDSADES